MSKKIQLSLLSVALLSSLHAKDVAIEPIMVTSATKSSQSIKDVTSSVTVITSEEIEEKRYSTVTQALNSVAGISFTNYGGLGKSTFVFVRGFDSKRVLVMIDGVRYNDLTGLSGAPFEHLMISDIEQIEVIKGAQSGIWGAGATAGVINIITKGAKKGLHGFLNTEYGSFDTMKYGGGASYKTTKYYVKASVSKVDTNGFSAQAPKDEDIENYEKDGYRNTTSNLKLGFNINETNKIDLTHTKINAHTDYDVYNNPDADNTYRTNDTFTNINFNHIDSFNEVDIYMSKSNFDRDFSSGNQYDGEIYEYGLKSNIAYNEKDFILLGTDYKTFEHKNDLNEEYSNLGVFMTNSNTFRCPTGGKMIVTQSLRYDKYSTFDNQTTGKLGIKRIINKDLFIGANYGTAYNVPTLYNLYNPTYGNTNLSPEDTQSYDVAIGYKNLKVSYFNSKIKDMIDYHDPDGWSGPIAGGYHNLEGTTQLKGLEVEYATNLSEDVYITANYTYLKAQNNDGEDLARRPKDTIKFSADYYGFKDLHLGGYGEYVGTRYNKDNKQGEQTGKYTVFNLVANYDVNKNFAVYAKIDNLFDTYYQVVDGYSTAPLSGYIGIKASF